uniref:(California timema) hypothetical protein n=1 Tax=Timema californicum TaxID=61474 RepID=A0A7R9JD07_TIMCA|nr:unnamed protein product [Timema californicum]
MVKLLYFESVMNGGRAEEFRVSDAKGWEGDESAKELFHVWKKLRRKCVGEQTETSFGMSNKVTPTSSEKKQNKNYVIPSFLDHILWPTESPQKSSKPKEKKKGSHTQKRLKNGCHTGKPNRSTGLYSLRANRPVPRLTLSFQIRSKRDATLEALIGQESAPKPPPPLKDHKCKNSCISQLQLSIHCTMLKMKSH